MSQALAQLDPPAPRGAPRAGQTAPAMTGAQKAAVIVRLLLAEGARLPLASLPEHMQAALTEQMGLMRAVDRDTLRRVVEEFLHDMDRFGLTFPGGVDNALALLDGHISPSAASRLRRLSGAAASIDPWDRIAALDADRLVQVLADESVEVAAVLLSKIAVSKAADLLGRLPGDRARRIAYAVSLTGNVGPETVRRIGLSLAAQLETVAPRAFDTGPVERVGAILNHSVAQTRDDVLLGLDEADKGFAELVRRAIFTFADIPARLDPRDIQKVSRAVPQPQLVTALAGAQAEAAATAAEFILSGMSQRMATTLREEMAALGKIREKDAEAAMAAVVAAIRDLEQAGEVTLRIEEEAD